MEFLCSKLRARCSLLETRLKVADPNLDLEELFRSASSPSQDSEMLVKEDDEDEEGDEDHILELQSDSSINDENATEEPSGLVDSFQTQMTVLTDGEDEEEQSHFFGKSSM